MKIKKQQQIKYFTIQNTCSVANILVLIEQTFRIEGLFFQNLLLLKLSHNILQMSNKEELIQAQVQFKQSNNLQEIQNFSKKEENNRSGRWKKGEHTKYLAFLRKYYYIMRDSGLRYHYRIFNTMAEMIGTRNSSQCKSHHQKMLQKYNNSLQNITFDSEQPNEIITIGKGQTHLKNKEVVKKGVKNFEMRQKRYVILRVDGTLLVIINENLIAEY